LRSKELPAAWCSCGITRVCRRQGGVPMNRLSMPPQTEYGTVTLLSCDSLIVSDIWREVADDIYDIS
jgi:hypothetical protein